MLDAADIEGDALDIYRQADTDPEDPPGTIHLARRHPDVDIEFAIKLRFPALYIAPANDNARGLIRVRTGASRVAMEFRVGHELAEMRYRRLVVEHIERLCNNLSAALILPRPYMMLARLACGLNLPRISGSVNTTQTITALRWGEVFDDEPTAIVEPHRIRRRGPDTLPPAREIHRIVAAGGCAEMRVVPLTDHPGRVFLVAR